MKSLRALFSKKKPSSRMKQLTEELETLNDNPDLETDQRLKIVLANVENVQELLSVSRDSRRLKA